MGIHKWQISVPGKTAANRRPQAQQVCAEDRQEARTPSGVERCHVWMDKIVLSREIARKPGDRLRM